MTKIRLKGELQVPGDKSISHRSIMFASLAKGNTYIKGFLKGADCLSTISCFQKMGVEITEQHDEIKVVGRGLYGLQTPDTILDCGNSGTTMRLLSGILSAQNFSSILTGDESIQRRPMNRVIKPLSLMGADIKSKEGLAPLYIGGKPLSAITYESPVASAQIKSAILLAGLYAEGKTTVVEPTLSRNHTELMLRNFGADIQTEYIEDVNHILRPHIRIEKAKELYANDITVPSDISSAAYFIAAASIVPDSEVILKNVGINPTRDGILKVAKAMGADVQILHTFGESELSADILIRSSSLHGTKISGDIIPTLIDEIPIIAAMAVLAEGQTVIRDAQELKVKESNRIKVMVEELSKIGADIIETEDGMIINGGKALHSATIHSYKDHRIAMTFAILSLVVDGGIQIIDRDCVDISYPNFYEDLESIIEK